MWCQSDYDKNFHEVFRYLLLVPAGPIVGKNSKSNVLTKTIRYVELTWFKFL